MNKVVLLLLIVCLCKSIESSCGKKCGERSCPSRGCDSCMSPCSDRPYPCDRECECLKAAMRFPEVEYPMTVIEIKPYCGGCGWCT